MMDDFGVKPVEEMTDSEKMDEMLILMRGFGAALNALADSPMAKMFPGISQMANGKK